MFLHNSKCKTTNDRPSPFCFFVSLSLYLCFVCFLSLSLSLSFSPFLYLSFSPSTSMTRTCAAGAVEEQLKYFYNQKHLTPCCHQYRSKISSGCFFFVWNFYTIPIVGNIIIIINDTRSTSIAQLRSGSSSRTSTRSAVMPAISAAASPIYIHINSKIPIYCGKSPMYGLKSCLIVYCQKSPTCCEKNIAYCEKSPTHRGKSPIHNLKSRLIVYCQKSPKGCEKKYCMLRKEP